MPVRSLEILDAEVAALERNFPKAFKQILAFLAQGSSPARISDWTTIDVYLIRRIRDAQPEAVDKMRERIAINLGEGALHLSELLNEKAHKLTPNQIAPALATAVEKYQLMSGGVTQRTEHRNVATPEELLEMFNQLPKARVVESEVIKDKEVGNGDMRHD
jgi:hypothetical protein